MFNKSIHTEIEIFAPKDMVWSILTETTSYPDWNPFIKQLHGDLEVGNRLVVLIQPPNEKMMTFEPRLLLAAKDSELRWLGHFILPGVFDGEHVFRVEDTGQGSTRFIQEEKFSGVLIPFFKQLFNSTEEGFRRMNVSLKSRAEAMVA